MIIGTFIIDFQTTEFEPDARVAREMLDSYQKEFSLAGSFALDEPMETAGWSFAKLFLAGQLVEEMYAKHGAEVDSSKGKKFEDKFISWLAVQLKSMGCRAQIKMAREMKTQF